jgi:dTDP-4-dehydrorhamnose 3,5-epimerase
MKFTETALNGAFTIDIEKREDARGFFARTYCATEFAAYGLPGQMVQTNMSLTRSNGTLRGMHYQTQPHAEDKLVRCMQGAIWDAIVDIRPDSLTYCQWIGVELSAANGRMLLVPKGFAHGFLTLTDDAVVTYQVSAFYSPGAERGARHDDPSFGIQWPQPVLDMSDKDRSWPDFVHEPHRSEAPA